MKENKLSQLPVLPWEQGAIFDEIVKKGLTIKAIIAAPKVIESARNHNPLSFCFDPAENATKVRNWEEIAKTLQ